MQGRPQWTPYQPALQPTPTIGNPTSSTTSSGLMGILKKLNPVGGNLTETLDQIQNFLKMAQSITPKIQEYGPLIKSLPAMYAMMKDFEDEDDEEEVTDQLEPDDESTDELDQILGLDLEGDHPETEDLTESPIEPPRYQGDNLYKIETLDDQTKPIYHAPMLFI